MLNNYAWSICKDCNDLDCIQSALVWSKQMLIGEDENKVFFLDTYASLLYKAGQKNEAINMLEEAVNKFRKGKGAKELKKRLIKMKAWE